MANGKIGIALALVTPLCVSAALAQETAQQPKGPTTRFERADADKSGDVSFSEFAAANDRYLGAADANGDGKMTPAEIADAIMRLRAERTAQRIVRRFDSDGDGALTRAEIDARQKIRFDRLDKDKNGKITADEMPVPARTRAK